MNIFAVGVDNFIEEELDIISGGNDAHTFTAVSWEQLGSMSYDVAAQMCTTGKSECQESCCGLCFCDSCEKPVLCQDTDYCTNETMANAHCCIEPPTDCDIATGNTNKCITGSCSTAIGQCTYSNLTCQPDNLCFGYTCNPVKGLPCEATPKWVEDACVNNYCDSKLQIVSVCVFPTY